MIYQLNLFQNSRCDAVSGIAVALTRRCARLDLRYIVSGAISNVRWPLPAPPTRTDGLWQHTCFEAFVRAGASSGYCELNFSSSSEWAAYRFTGYRAGMNALDIAAPSIERRGGAESYELAVTFALETADLPAGGIWRLGLSAVIEEMNGRKSYWALAHPGAKPDFHHADSFTLDLPA